MFGSKNWCSLWEWLIWSFPEQDEEMWGYYVHEDALHS